jgi:hypothetical protein
VKTATDRFAEAIEAAEMMFGEMLRSYVLRARHKINARFGG